MNVTVKPRIDLTTDACRLEVAQQLYQRFCKDMAEDPSKAKVRLVSGIQVALRDALVYGRTDSVT